MCEINLTKAFLRRLMPAALLCLWAFAHEARSALIISGPSSGAPGDQITLSIQLDVPFSVDIDDLNLILEFDAGVLHGLTAAIGALLPAGSTTPNAANGTLSASFDLTRSGIGPGVLTQWTFGIDPGAAAHTQTSVRARLLTSIIDDMPTGELPSEPLVITIVPEPSLWALLLGGVALLGLVRGWLQGATGRY
jgi:hypothetical protein